MASGKWITDIAAETATIDAARRVLGLRLAALRDAVGEIFQDRDDAFEDVHQLRVAVRRASSAFDIFEPCLGKKAYRTAANRLKKLRRTAGQARDLDVFLLEYTRRLPDSQPDEARVLDLLCGYAIAERIPAQLGLQEACAGYPFDWERWMSETIGGLISPPREIGRMHALGQQYLSGLCDRVYGVADAATPSFEELHSVRIAAKRLRYSMEVFAGCFPSAFREELYPCVEELQEILGVVSDAHVELARAQRLLRGLTTLLPTRCGRWTEALERFAEELKRKRVQGCEQLETWKARAVHSGFQALFHSLLTSAPACDPVRCLPVAQAS
jgi:CHAD domain-containing protein